MHRYSRVLIVVLLVISLSACSKIKREFYVYQATKAHDKGDHKTAIIKYEQVLEVNPNDSNVIYNLGAAYVYDQQFEKARQQIQKLRKLERKDYAGLLQETVDKAADQEKE